MSAVFIPVSFKRTSRGYQQFAVTLAIAILISAVNALTLSPALCVLLLKPHTDSKHQCQFQRTFFIAFNTNFDRMNKKYVKSLGFLTRKKMDRCCGSFMFSELPFSFPNYAFRIYS
jgi:HAE1 family hydrophobic/amphiphilic exporter-1